MKENGNLMKNTVRLNFEFPRNHYPFLKMLCAQKGITLREFATEVLIDAIEDYEEKLLAKKAKKRLKDMKRKDNISWDRARRSAGWKDAE